MNMEDVGVKAKSVDEVVNDDGSGGYSPPWTQTPSVLRERSEFEEKFE